MLGQFNQALSGTIGPCLLVMSLSVLLTVGEGRNRPASRRWRAIGVAIGLAAAVVFAILRGTAILNRRSTVNLPMLILGVILDIALIAVIVRSQGIVERWRRTSASRVSADEKDDASVRRARLWMNVANGVAAADIAVTIFFAMPDVILQLTNFVDTGDSPFTSEPEEYSLVDGVATIPFSQVEDGHLHRFAYTAADGTEMRFIIILKNGGAYGVGLDACETCGDAGYYEQDGKIICKRCDVAINLATIGFKGGCNPIPFPYQVDDGAIIIHAADLDALSAHFQ
ncbi:Fe-S-containing protein [Bifidobacterium pullorum]|uniref:Fe-S-containing protein n=1 Tax=Bifidobacterium pullorum TaxID=78448 RepID=UPI003A91AE4A